MELIIFDSFYLGQNALLNPGFVYKGHFGPFWGSQGSNGRVLGGWRPPGHALEKSGPQGPRNQAKIDLAWISGLSPLPK